MTAATPPKLRLVQATPRNDPELTVAWERARGEWLAQKGRGSPHTARAYARALTSFADYLEASFSVPLWMAETAHVRAWQEHLAAEGRAPATIAQALAAVSSFYAFVIGERLLVDGVEQSIFTDRKGRPRANPCRSNNLERPPARPYGHSRPLPSKTISRMLERINTETRTGARDYALLLTFIYTGWRCAEVLGMQWGDITENPARPGEYICRWRGKGSKEEIATLPARCYEAIELYLDLDGRSPAGMPAEGAYIWRPLAIHGCQNFVHVGTLSANRPITQNQANNILRKRLRAAGVADPKQYHVHSLRHTFAHAYMAAKGDMLGLSRRMHHASIAVTQMYLESVQAPADDYSEQLGKVLGI